MRLDAELVRRGLARSREQASELIAAGRVSVAGQAAGKAAAQVHTDAAITVRDGAEPAPFASRGGRKLAGALAAFAGAAAAVVTAAGAETQAEAGPSPGAGAAAAVVTAAGAETQAEAGPSPGAGATVRAGAGAEAVAAADGGEEVGATAGLRVSGRRCLDAGASTGGFTDVLLRAGAAHVVAVDVGYGQLAWPLRNDPRVTVLDRVNVRGLRPGQVAPPPELVTADLSFISLVLVLPALAACAAPDADFVLLVKPQFEVGRGMVGPGGVVRDPGLRESAVASVAAAARELGLGVLGVVASELPGPSGNVEYFLWLRRGAPPLDGAALRRAITEGPQ
jgi:23S rRNA (cytidine1920-2'-O)/16S rRNA (cytidine1409-2'-O)-methyltransferase